MSTEIIRPGRAETRLRSFVRFLVRVVLLFFPFASPAQTPTNFTIAPPPSWVVPVEYDLARKLPTAQQSDGTAWLLLDDQRNVATQESFLRVVKRVQDSSGVQSGSQVAMLFDPAYHRLTIHQVRVIRDQEVLDRLDAAKIRVLQQERDLERHIYDGTLSAVLFLEDVRAGDCIEYAFTLRGENPIFDGKYVGSSQQGWYAPFQRQLVRVLWPAARTLRLRNHLTASEPQVKPLGDLLEYRWELADVPPVAFEGDIPLSHNPLSWVQFTEFADWAEVAAWAAKLYTTPPVLSPELESAIAKWKAAPGGEEERVIAVLDFMQEQVRYLGIEFGPHSHQPTDPSVVFARRFGDCKDKAFLLSLVLNRLGVAAAPALVNTYVRERLVDWAPSPVAFNHVVVAALVNDRTIWLDPTRSHQKGPLLDRFFPQLGRALIVSPSARDLTVVDTRRAGWPKTEMRETFVLRGTNEPGQLKVQTRAYGADAERLRAYLAVTSRDDVAKHYTDFYVRMYPKITAMAPPQFVEQPGRNSILVNESYLVSGIWSYHEQNRRWVASFYPSSVRDFVAKPAIVQRTLPLGVMHPRDVTLITEIQLRTNLTVRTNRQTLGSEALIYDYQLNYTNRRIQIVHAFRTLADAVPVARVAAHLRTLEQITEHFGYELSLPGGGAGGAGAFTPNWTIILLAGLWFVVCVVGAVLLHRWRFASRPDDLPPVLDADPLNGIGGWLILMAIGLTVAPITAGIGLIQLKNWFAMETWMFFTTPGGASYHSLWAPVVLMEILVGIARFVAALLLVVLFYTKRAEFPRLAVIVILGGAIFLVVDQAVTEPLIKAANPSAIPAVPRLVGSVVGALLWTAYLLKSERVRRTFVR